MSLNAIHKSSKQSVLLQVAFFCTKLYTKLDANICIYCHLVIDVGYVV